VDADIHVFLTLAVVGGEWSASRPVRFNPVERAPDTHWIGGWVGLRTSPDDMEKRKFLTLPGLINSCSRSHWNNIILIHGYIDSRIISDVRLLQNVGKILKYSVFS
jgi:hypothetical protein